MEAAGMRLGDIIALYGLKALAAVAIFFVGRWLAKIVKNFTEKLMRKSKVDETLISFTTSVVYVALLTFVVVAALGHIGIETTSFIAVLGAAGLAVGFALQGSLANLAAGILLIIFRPFKKGDFIAAAGETGSVEEIRIFSSQLTTPDNKAITIPNAKITSDNITNFSAKEIRRVDLVFGVGYGDDIQKVKETLHDLLSQDERVLKDPPPTIGLLELGDSSVNFAVRPWVNTSDYWPFYFDTMERVKQRFDAEGITIPYPQRDVHMIGSE